MVPDYLNFLLTGAKKQEYTNASTSQLVDANDSRFLAPVSMIEEVKAACRESGQQIPETPWDIARVIYRSLAVCYGKAIREIEDISNKSYNTLLSGEDQRPGGLMSSQQMKQG